MLLIAPGLQVPVDELAARIGMEHLHREWQQGADRRKTLLRGCLPLVPLGSGDHPIGCSIRIIDRKDIVPGGGAPTMSHRVHLSVAWGEILPRAFEDGDRWFEDASFGGGDPSAQSMFLLKGEGMALHRHETHAKELRGGLIGMMPLAVPFQDGDIFSNHRMQQFAAGVIPHFPDLHQGGDRVWGIDAWAPGTFARIRSFRCPLALSQADRWSLRTPCLIAIVIWRHGNRIMIYPRDAR